MVQRYGMTVPFQGPLHEQRARFEELAALGYTDLWSAEANTTDGLVPLALASVWAPTLRLGTAILPVYTRGPALLAQSIATMELAAPGRFVAGIGASSNIIVENWNGLPFTEPYKRVRDTLRFLRKALAGEKIGDDYEAFHVKGFTLAHTPETPPPILVAALREGMLKLAGREGDGAGGDELGGLLEREHVLVVSATPPRDGYGGLRALAPRRRSPPPSAPD